MIALETASERAGPVTIAQRPIAIACSGLGQVRRGNETWARTIAEALQAADEPIQLFGGGPLPAAPCPYRKVWNIPREWIGWRHFLSWGRRYAYEQQSFARALAWRFRTDAPAIVHTADPVLAYRLNLVARRLGFQLVYKDGLLLGPDWCRRFDWVQVLAPHYLDEAAAQGIDTRNWFVIPHMVCPNRFHPPPDRRAARRRILKDAVADDALVVLAAGDFASHSNKRLDWIIDEIVRLGPHSNIHLMLCGQATPAQERQLRSKAAGLGGRLHLFANVLPEHMPEIYQAADVFVHAALREPFGIVLIEALASGLPVIGHRYPVTEWIVGNGGICIDMTAPGELAAAIALWKDHPNLRRQRSQLARQEARERFSPERIVPPYRHMYATVRHTDTRQALPRTTR